MLPALVQGQNLHYRYTQSHHQHLCKFHYHRYSLLICTHCHLESKIQICCQYINFIMSEKWQKTESLEVTIYQVHADNRGGETPKKNTTHLSIQLVNAYAIHTVTHHLMTLHISLYNHIQGAQTLKILLKLEHTNPCHMWFCPVQCWLHPVKIWQLVTN